MKQSTQKPIKSIIIIPVTLGTKGNAWDNGYISMYQYLAISVRK